MISNVSDGTTRAPIGAHANTVSVIIVSYFTGPLLQRSVLSCLRQPEISEVIVVNNGNWSDSIDKLVEVVGEDRERLKILSGHGNVGFAKGCNLGAKASTGDYIFLLNPDAVLPDHAVAKMLGEAKPLMAPWLLSGKLINPDGTEQAGSRRRPLTPWRAFVEMTKLYKVAPRHPYFLRFNQHQEPCPKETTSIATISGACMFMPRETYFLIDGMDEEYFLHVEDVDFCLRLREAGGEVYFAPSVDILHFKSSSRSSEIRVEIRKAQSLTRYFWQHFREPYPWVFLALVTCGVWGIAFLRTGGTLLKRFAQQVGLRARKDKKTLARAKRITAKRLGR